MSSRLGERRAELLEALRAGNVRVATSGRFAAPVVILEPADPWSEPARMPGRSSRWQLTAIAGTADSDAALLELAELVDGVDRALRTLDGVGLPTWGRPVDRTIGEIAHASTIGTFTASL
jgi:hypothetical protein